MARGRPYEFPDPSYRSVAEPHWMIERDAIIGLYNQANTGGEAVNLSESVRQWFEAEARKRGWSEVQFVSTAAVLTAKVQLVP